MDEALAVRRAPARPSRTTRGTGRPTSSRPTAAWCTCARSCRATPTRSWPSTPGSPSATRYLRYFGPYPHISPRDLERFTVVDHDARVALVALLGDEIIAVGRYEGTYGPDGTEVVGPAEVAFVVRDDHQSRGLGSILLEHLAAAARERGVRRFEAEVLAENTQMVRVFRDAGYQVSREFADGVLHLEFDVDPTERSMEVRDAREQRAEARSVHNVLHPRSVAVIGASTDPARSATRCCCTCCAATSPARSTRSTRRPARSAACARTRRSPTSRTTWTSPWSPCRRPGWARSWTPAWPRASRRWSCSAPASPTPGRTG